MCVHNAAHGSPNKEDPPFSNLVQALDILLHHPEFALASMCIQVSPYVVTARYSGQYYVCSTFAVASLKNDIFWNILPRIQMNGRGMYHPFNRAIIWRCSIVGHFIAA